MYSHWDRYLGMTAAMTQRPVPTAARDFLQPDEAQKVQLMMRMDYATMHLFQMSHTERNRLLEVALSYYRLHLPDFPDLKSLSVLQELYS